MAVQPFWRAEVYLESDNEPGKTVTSKLFAGIYATRQSAERAAIRKCNRVRGFGFYIHELKVQPRA